jgi:hypothetical protein
MPKIFHRTSSSVFELKGAGEIATPGGDAFRVLYSLRGMVDVRTALGRVTGPRDRLMQVVDEVCSPGTPVRINFDGLCETEFYVMSYDSDMGLMVVSESLSGHVLFKRR